MPGTIVSGVLEIVFQAVFESACYYIGRAVVPLLSIGRWKCDKIVADVPRKKLRAAGLYHFRGQQICLTVEATQLVGFSCIVLLAGGGVLVWYLGK